MKKYIAALIVLLVTHAHAQKYTINWKSPKMSFASGGIRLKTLDFDQSSDIDPLLKVGYFVIKYNGALNSASLSHVVYTRCSSEEDSILDKSLFSNKIEQKILKSTERGATYSFISINPIVIGTDGKLYKIQHFNLITSQAVNPISSARQATTASQSSVLASGDWYKVSVNKTGVYKLDFNYLKSLGISEATDPKSIQVYGLGGMLPESNLDNVGLYDIPEVALLFVGNSDATFDAHEYFLVYLQGPDKLVYRGDLDLKKNLYSDQAYYFITYAQTLGKRITNKQELSDYDAAYDYYDYLYKHEIETENYIHSGRDWLGESLVANPSLSFNITLPELVGGSDITVKGQVQGSNADSTRCRINFNGTANSYKLYNRDNGPDFNRIQVRSFQFNQISDADDVVNGSYLLGFQYTQASSIDKTNLDYFSIAALAKLNFNGNFLNFRSLDAIGNTTSKYIISTSTPSIQVWDVTYIGNITGLGLKPEPEGVSFIDSSVQYTEYVAIDTAGVFENPVFVTKIVNQDLHSIDVPDMLIVVNNTLKSTADRLADFRRTHDGYDIQVVTVDKIYNEFSSGAQDISGIRNFTKYLYDQNPSKFKWLLLFGGCSYDYKDRITNNTNFVPIYETVNSSDLILSYQSDDYYGLLDDNEGGTLIGGMLDIGIGRLPVRSVDEANAVVDKLIHYATSKSTFDKWKNNLCFICDDGDANLHMNSTEQLVTEVMKHNAAIKINKLYLPLYPEVSTPLGQTSPALTNRLLDEITKGTFLLNYSGHGREIGWAEENLITIDEIKNLINIDKLFLMITATCEFGRYDDPNNFSSIMQAILNTNGGAIATIGATRPVFASSNLKVNTSMMSFLYETNNGKYNTIGDIMRKSKNDGTSVLNDENVKNYGLLSDPSITLCYPKYDVQIDSILDEHNIPKDTLKALSKVTVKGSVNNGATVNDFNGVVTVTLYDKEVSKLTKYDPSSDYGSDPSSIIEPIQIRESVIYQGNAAVKNGKFSASFMIPKDISYVVGNGLILTYAKNDSSTIDAAGGFEDFSIGDSDDNASLDSLPPVVQLYLNDTTFKSNGIVGKDFTFIAKISDESGINLSRSAVGHEILLTLDSDTKNSIILNDYYLSEENSFNKGRVTYPMTNVSEGSHTLTFKVWDVFNNSTTEKIAFVVSKDSGITIGVVDHIPNPFDDFDLFSFSHNRAGEDLSMEIEIYDCQGVMIRKLYSDIPTASAVVSNINWQTKINQNQYNIATGLYVYRLLLKSKYDGSTTTKAEKLVFIK